MDIKLILEMAGGRGAVASACKVTRQAVQLWVSNNRLPFSEISGRTSYARIICNLAAENGHEIEPLDLCPGAAQYMREKVQTGLKAA